MIRSRYRNILTGFAAGVVIALAALLFHGCTSESVTGNNAPNVDAGTGATISFGQPVQLNGTASDADGDPLTITWSIAAPANSTAQFSDKHSLAPTITPDIKGVNFVLSLSVSDGITTVSDSITIVVTANSAPVVGAGADKVVSNGTSSVPLSDATASDSDGDTMTYAWTVIKPTGKVAASLFTSTTVLNPYFLPDATDTKYIVTLTANDGTASSSDSVAVSVGNPPDNAPAGTLVINGGAATTYSIGVQLTLHATDDYGVVAYYVSESSATPTIDAAGWVSVTTTETFDKTNTSFTLSSGLGVKTVYVWYKDDANNVSSAASASITLAKAPGGC